MSFLMNGSGQYPLPPTQIPIGNYQPQPEVPQLGYAGTGLTPVDKGIIPPDLVQTGATIFRDLHPSYMKDDVEDEFDGIKGEFYGSKRLAEDVADTNHDDNSPLQNKINNNQAGIPGAPELGAYNSIFAPSSMAGDA